MSTHRVSIRAALDQKTDPVKMIPVVQTKEKQASIQPPKTAVSVPATQPVVVEREKPGYSIRKDLLKQCKLIAVETDRKIYNVIEEALEEHIKRYKKQKGS